MIVAPFDPGLTPGEPVAMTRCAGDARVHQPTGYGHFRSFGHGTEIRLNRTTELATGLKKLGVSWSRG